MAKQVTRREFVSDSAKAAAAAALLPHGAAAAAGLRDPRPQKPAERLKLAIIGAGGMGMSNAEELTGEDIVALCDVDFGYVDKALFNRLRDRETKSKEEQEKLTKLEAAYKSARRYGDYRELLAKEKELDGVVIATPDHLHAVIAAAFMKAHKAVYVQKPLTHSVEEARALRALARTTGVVTQMGNQGHSSEDARRINEWVQAGVIGPVHEVHVWTNRPIWPQGIPRPGQPPAVAAAPPPPAQPGKPQLPPRLVTQPWNERTVDDALATALGNPGTAPFNWDLYQGPVTDVPYHPIYHPFNWRGWLDFGVGALGDMGAHLIDHPFWALGLSYPSSIEATSSPFGGDSKSPASYPLAMTVHYQFPARGSQPPVRLSWYDGGLMPPRHELLPFELVLNRDGGVMFVGEKGILLHETYGSNPRILPESLMEEAMAVPKTFPRVVGTHEQNWVDAIRGKTKATSPFEYSAQLTEVMILGLVALRTGQGRKIFYDGDAGRVTNVPEANKYLKADYRTGWSL